MRHSFKTCVEVSDICPVEATVLGYYPNRGSGIFFAVAFALCMIAAAVLGVWKRTWTFGAAITVGLILETAGRYSSMCDGEKNEERRTKRKTDQLIRIYRPHPPQR